ncbi:MAG: RNA 2',3'-cyclic phosphodiesterase [Phycisphaerae bacterium]|nr:RNA 2',3'-cyclic phosphodiesterase [Phycisphaerae bacterium]
MRCFLAIELPEAVHERLRSLQDRLRAAAPGVRWTRPDQIHLTVKFLGEVPDDQLPNVCRAAELVAAACLPFGIRIGGTGCFPPHGPVRIVWAGLVDPPAGLLDCQQACESAFASLGYPPEDRRFHPHLTLGRVKASAVADDLRAAVAGESRFSGGSFAATELVVFQSILSASGPAYAVMSRVAFRGT